MSRFLEIRTLLGMTQQEIAEVLGCVQSNVSFLDRGQTITPDVAGKLIDAARALGVALTFDHIYRDEQLPAALRRTEAVEPRPQDWAELLAQLAERGWPLIQVAARIGVRLATLRALALGEMADAPHAVGQALLKLHASGEQPALQQTASKAA